MAKDRIIIAELADTLASKLKLNSKQADEFLKSLAEVIEEGLISDGHVKIKGLGIFKLIWNEPRKSVDVNTGEDIIIEGYYKAGFTPDVAFKDAVNEPFAHLEAVVIGGDPTHIQDAVKPVVPVTTEDVVDPLKMLHEQASEIKGILSELGSMKRSKKKAKETLVEDTKVDESGPVESAPVEIAPVEIAPEEVQTELIQVTEVESDEPVKPEPVAQEEVYTLETQEQHIPEELISVEPEVEENAPVEVSAEVNTDEQIAESEIAAEVIETEQDDLVSTIETPEPKVVYEEEKQTKYRRYQSNYNQAEIDRKRVRKPGRKLDVAFIVVMIIVAAIYLLKDYDIFHEFSKMMKSEEKQKMQFEAPEISDEMLTDSLYQDSLAMMETDTTLVAEKKETQLPEKTATTVGDNAPSKTVTPGNSAVPAKTQVSANKPVVEQKTPPSVTKSQVPAQKTQTVATNAQPVVQKPQTVAPKPQSVAQKPKSQVDSLRILFDKPRVYKEFIGSEEVRVGSRLTRISERHYGVKDFWVYIYEANKEKFITPDNVEPGTILKIPKLDPRIANPKNPRCMEYARELHDRYVKKK